MAKSSVTILSVYFLPVRATRLLKPFDGSCGYNSTFEIPACKAGEFKTLKVGNYFERTYIGERRYMDTPVYCDGQAGIARDLVQEWADHVPGVNGVGDRGGPGIMACEGDEPTQAEIDRATARQKVWANQLCIDAETNWINNKKDRIEPLHREAAIWLGRAEEYDWVTDRGTSRVQSCPMCARSIDARAVMCPNCNSVVDFDRFQQYQDRLEKLKAKMPSLEVPKSPATITPPIKNPQQQKTA